MNRRALLALASALIALVIADGGVAATTPPPPPDDGATDFIHKQAEAAAATYFSAIDPGVSQVACGRPAVDTPGEQFLCYAYSAEGQVLVAQVTIDDYGVPILADFGGGGPVVPSVPPTSAPSQTLASFQGTGSAVQLIDPITTTTIINVTHDGAGAFSVQPQQGGVPAGEPLFSATGPWQGRYVAGLGGTISALAVTADGNWTIDIQTGASALILGPAAPTSAETSDVVSYSDAADVPVTFEYTGAGPIVVRAITAAGPAVLVDEPGAFTGEITLPSGPGLVTIDAAGSWSIAYIVPPTDASTTATPTTAAT